MAGGDIERVVEVAGEESTPKEEKSVRNYFILLLVRISSFFSPHRAEKGRP